MQTITTNRAEIIFIIGLNVEADSSVAEFSAKVEDVVSKSAMLLSADALLEFNINNPVNATAITKTTVMIDLLLSRLSFCKSFQPFFWC